MASLSIVSLRKSYNGVSAVHDVSVDARDGELISLLGPSGCGKTTTLRAVAGFETPDAGSIWFDGRDVTQLLPEDRDVGMVFQDYALFPHLTVYQNCLFGLQMRGVRKAEANRRVAEVLDMVQLKGLESRYPRQLSGGQQQRVALARALVIEPTLLLLDEPLANLDAVLRDEMRFFIRSLQRRVGITTLYVTHDQAEALLISDRIAVMFDGAVAQLDTPDGVYSRPRTRRVASFVGFSNFLEGTVSECSARNVTVIKTSQGPVTALRAGTLSEGAQVTVLIRPEAIDIAGDRVGSHDNTLSGSVNEAFFLGNVMDYRVSVRAQMFQVHARPDKRFTRGQAVSLGFGTEAAWVLTE